MAEEPDNERAEGLSQRRAQLRRHVEHVQDNVEEIDRYFRLLKKNESLQAYDKIDVHKELECLFREASRLGGEIRDELQLQVGTAALEESRKSTELSNSQIREAKSGVYSVPVPHECTDITKSNCVRVSQRL